MQRKRNLINGNEWHGRLDNGISSKTLKLTEYPEQEFFFATNDGGDQFRNEAKKLCD